ncbi:unnamed protein product [Aphanomyces euteiches]
MAKQRVSTLEMQARTQTVEMEKLQDEIALLQSQLASSKTSLELYEEKVKNFGEYEAFVQRELSSRQANYDQLMRLYSSESVNHRETKAKLHELHQELFVCVAKCLRQTYLRVKPCLKNLRCGRRTLRTK